MDITPEQLAVITRNIQKVNEPNPNYVPDSVRFIPSSNPSIKLTMEWSDSRGTLTRLSVSRASIGNR